MCKPGKVEELYIPSMTMSQAVDMNLLKYVAIILINVITSIHDHNNYHHGYIMSCMDPVILHAWVYNYVHGAIKSGCSNLLVNKYIACKL